ncbi:MAG: hypothetical protein D6744_06365 [Planctomycetota bacterium]|nr:MAG: hypothetical protein D6744_06365 [Planctomycetota bacterium]
MWLSRSAVDQCVSTARLRLRPRFELAKAASGLLSSLCSTVSDTTGVQRDAEWSKAMRRKLISVTAGAAILASGTLMQSCVVVYDGYPAVFVNLRDFPHFDGDGEDSLLDNLFGFDDDDD